MVALSHGVGKPTIRIVRQMAQIAIVAGLLLACASGPVPTQNCWVALRGEYRLVGADGGGAGQAATEDAARTIQARVNRIGLANFLVRTRSDAVIELDLPPMADPSGVRDLVEPTGNVAFVPIPEGTQLDTGERVPADLAPLFGRDALSSVSLSTDTMGRQAIDIVLNPAAAIELADWSRRNIGKQLAVTLDGTVLMAPVIQAPLEGGEVQISGGLDEIEANRLVTILGLPSLPGRLEEIRFGPINPPTGCATTP